MRYAQLVPPLAVMCKRSKHIAPTHEAKGNTLFHKCLILAWKKHKATHMHDFGLSKNAHTAHAEHRARMQHM